tara:strand:- start:1125 stop:1628 length:504 start_codon:yes stop_codon:yes gene_type:complete
MTLFIKTRACSTFTKEPKMANTRNIQYTTHKGGNATYSDIPLTDKLGLLKMLNNGLYEALEISNYNSNVLSAIFTQDATFNKHIVSGDPKINNCAVSFLSGLLKQHAGNTGKDISVKMLPGITLATQLLNKINPAYTIYTFDEVEVAPGNAPRIAPTTFETLFGKEV